MTGADMIAWVKKHPLNVSCIAVALLAGVGVYFARDAVDTAGTVLEDRTAQGTRIAENVKNAAQLPEQAEAIAAARARIEERLILPSELAKNLQYFYRLEAETGVELVDIRQNSSAANKAVPRGAKAGFSAVNYSVTFRGDYWAVLNCLRRLEAGAHYCRLLSGSIDTISPDRAGPVKLSLSIELLGRLQP